eukprot:CAMPEP_0118666156 /NCGR_PEP_ID=MMETSP0785-20121206/19045_1 /TAXON_ID=91992 /ORGANISM="Bolidomonas pacifica, Strain CCMP 1866" /LENGTH=397 /DNA_ID=CAMNT_0006560409 /DNA_START=119 /DNA_END=1308 /DNA_ORIENTATION=-
MTNNNGQGASSSQKPSFSTSSALLVVAVAVVSLLLSTQIDSNHVSFPPPTPSEEFHTIPGSSTFWQITSPLNTSSPLVLSFQNVLPPPVLTSLLSDAQNYYPYASKKFKGSHVFDLTSEPTNLIEQAVLKLSSIAKNEIETIYPDLEYTEYDVKYGEYWFRNQSRISGANRSNIHVHYDKDEELSRLNNMVKFPMLSTVTYLNSWGGPTFILNQTVASKMNDVGGGWLSWPRENKHTVFRGDLAHGVLGDLSRDFEWGTSEEENHRWTLIINWWSKPMWYEEKLPASINSKLTPFKEDFEYLNIGIVKREAKEIDVCIENPREGKEADMKLDFEGFGEGINWVVWSGAVERFNELDRKSKDNKVSREEFEKTGVGEAFGDADWNGDGILSWEEYFGT